MTISNKSSPVTGRGLASAVAVFLGGYLLLLSFTSQLGTVTMFALLGKHSGIPLSSDAVLVLQFVFAIVVVVAGLLLGRGSIGARLLGSGVVIVGSVVTLFVLGARNGGLLPFPEGPSGAPFYMIFGNAWFAVLLFVGAGWLISRSARRAWLAILAVVILLPLPFVLAYNNVEGGLAAIILFGVSAIVGGVIIAAERPWRD